MTECTWEPEKNLTSCKSMVADYNRTHPKTSDSRTTQPKNIRETHTVRRKTAASRPAYELQEEMYQDEDEENY